MQFIELYFDFEEQPPKKEIPFNMQSLATPETRLVELACKIQDMFILYDGSGEIIGNKTPTVEELALVAKNMADMVMQHDFRVATPRKPITNEEIPF